MKLCRDRGWPELHSEPPADGAETAADGAETADGAESAAQAAVRTGPKTYDGANPTFMLIMRAWMHRWKKDGSHLGFRTTQRLVNKVNDVFFHTIPYSNASRWLRHETSEYKAGRGMRSKPNLADAIKTVRASPEDDESIIVDEPTQTIFKQHLIPKLICRCQDLISIDGFGPDIVTAFATQVYCEELGDAVDDASWEPSLQWCYWFMRHHLNLARRRITSHCAASPAQVELQRRLHELNVDKIAIARVEGLHDCFLLCSDEFGQKLGPCSSYKWVRRDDKETASDRKEDKRQYTADVVNTANGDVPIVVQIWEGSTDTSLPSAQVREEFKGRILFDQSSNHWANHDTKVPLLKTVWAWVCAKWADMKLPGEPRCIYLLDCWPVNLTAKLRAEMDAHTTGGMQLLFVPAGATGKYQVNDVYLHKPIKDMTKKMANRWRMGKIMRYRLERLEEIANGTDKTAADERLAQRVHMLTSLPVLRNRAPEWLWEGVKTILKKDDDGKNLIRKGWEKLYFNPVGGTAEAYRRRTERVEEQRKAEFARIVAAVAAGAEPTQLPPDADLDALVAEVARLEEQLHLDEAGQAQPRRRGKGGKKRSAAVRARVAHPAAAAADDKGVDEFDGLKVKELQRRCREEGLPVYGTKATLVARLRAPKEGNTSQPTGKRAHKKSRLSMAGEGDAAAAMDLAESEAEEETNEREDESVVDSDEDESEGDLDEDDDEVDLDEHEDEVDSDQLELIDELMRETMCDEMWHQ